MSIINNIKIFFLCIWVVIMAVKSGHPKKYIADVTKRIRRKSAILRIRTEMRLLGHNDSIFTDEEIEQGVINFGYQIHKIGLSVTELERALKTLSKI